MDLINLPSLHIVLLRGELITLPILDKQSIEFKLAVKNIKKSIVSYYGSQSKWRRALVMACLPCERFDPEAYYSLLLSELSVYGTDNETVGGTTDEGQLTSTPSAVKSARIHQPMHSNEVKNRTSAHNCNKISSLCLLPLDPVMVKAEDIPQCRHDVTRALNVKPEHKFTSQYATPLAQDVSVGKTTPITQDDAAQGQASRYPRRDHSTSFHHNETGMVDQVTENMGVDKSILHRSMRCTPPSADIIPNSHLPMPCYEVKIRTSNDKIKSRRDNIKFRSTSPAFKIGMIDPLMDFNEFENRIMRCAPPSADIIPNIHLPMHCYKVKNRTSTDDVKSLRLMPVIKAPYLPDWRFNLDAYALVNIEDGADGVIVGGTTGHTINVFGTSIKVIGNTGSKSTREAVHATEQGSAVGMHAALHINPYYGKTSLEGMVAHFECVLPMGPTVIYNVPSQTGQVIPPRVIHSIADSTNFAGVKECVGHGRVNEYTKSGITVWSGTMSSVMIQSGTMMLQGLYHLLSILFWD